MPSLAPQWRALAQQAEDPAFIAQVAQEFPGLAEALASPLDRRRVLTLLAAALAIGGLAGCDEGAPGGSLVPPVRMPANMVAGRPNFYATANLVDGYATGILVEHRMGRPIKVEGNPLHPASLGATDAFAQAQLLDFYDPDRAAALTARTLPSDRASLARALADRRTRLAATHGAGLRILTGAVTSPSLAAQIEALLKQYPAARWHQWQPISRDNVHAGAALAYGRPLEPVPKPAAADVIVAIDSDLLSSAPGHVRLARDVAARRNPVRATSMSRLYAIEPTPSLTGIAADHRFIVGPRDLPGIVTALAAAILGDATPAGQPAWLDAVVDDLRGYHGRALVHIGPDQPAEMHALVHAVNEALGARDTTIELIEPVGFGVGRAGNLAELVDDMRGGAISTLLIVDADPVYAAPGAMGFAEAMTRVEFSMALTPAPTDTSRASLWAVPMTHDWESWGDARAYDGTVTIRQPQSQPLYDGISPHRLLGMFIDASPPGNLEIVQGFWQHRFGGDFARDWHDALADGIVSGTAAAPVSDRLRPEARRQQTSMSSVPPLTLLLRPDPHLWDGRHANNGWLQELPRPLTKVTWDNPLLIAPALARQLDLRNGDRVALAVGDAKVTLPVWIMPGQAPDCVVGSLGFGRKQVGAVGDGAGVNLYAFVGRPETPSLTKLDGRAAAIATTEHHGLLVDAAGTIVRHGSLTDFTRDPHFLQHDTPSPELYRRRPPGPAAWAMSVDLNACIGCNACVVACQAENNIPVVGKEQVLLEREMHWLRIDRYYEGSADAPEAFFQPMMCMQCEQAPCEVVCPVGATVHDAEGLNVMVYNRCVGTRFCSNNCPYKVRRFNYDAFAAEEARPAAARNPEVTVRARGVMEKCTFCLQRIAAARIEADREDRPVGPVVTACQAACPTQALTFGNLADDGSDVARRKGSPLSYALLAEQNTHPRLSYEARIRNPNPAIDEATG